MLLHAIGDGINLLTWAQYSFAFADGYDAEAGRYQGLRAGQMLTLVDAQAPGILVKPDVAARQLAAERPPAPRPGGTDPSTTGVDEPTLVMPDTPTSGGHTPPPPPLAPKPKRFHGTVLLDATRIGRDAGRIAEKVIAHLDGLVHAKVRVTLEIEAELPDGAPDPVVRMVTENCRTLRFTSQGFEED